MPLKVKAHDLIHETGARKGTAIPVRGEARTLGLKADYRLFEKDCGVSREHCTVRSPDKHQSLWVEDRLSRKGTYVCIGGAGKACETFPVFPDVCLRLSKSNFYFAAPPERGREESSSEEESDEEDDDESDVSLSDDDDTVHGEVDHRLLVKFRGPQTKRQRRVVLTGSTTIGSSGLVARGRAPRGFASPPGHVLEVLSAPTFRKCREYARNRFVRGKGKACC